MDVEQRAREVVGLSWAGYWMERGRPDVAHDFGAFSRAEAWALQRFPTALTPPEGWALVPVEPTEAQWGGLARDVVMWMECYQTRSAESLLKHLRRCGTEIPKWLMDEVKGGSHSLDKGTVAAIIYKAMLAARPEVKS